MYLYKTLTLATLSSITFFPLASTTPQFTSIDNEINSAIFSQNAARLATSTSTAIPVPPSSSISAPVSTGTITVHVGNTPQSVGDLTGSDFINKMTSAITPLCPSVTDGNPGQCTGDNGEIEGVAHIDNVGNLGGGTLTFNVRDSSYVSNVERDGMIAIFATTMNSSASGTTNCKTSRYRSGCTDTKMMARDPLAPQGGNVPNADCTYGTKTICSGPDNVYIGLPNSNSYMNIDMTFTLPGGDFDCAGVLGFISDALSFIPAFDGIAQAVTVGVVIAKACCESDGCGTGGDKRWLLD